MGRWIRWAWWASGVKAGKAAAADHGATRWRSHRTHLLGSLEAPTTAAGAPQGPSVSAARAMRARCADGEKQPLEDVFLGPSVFSSWAAPGFWCQEAVISAGVKEAPGRLRRD